MANKSVKKIVFITLIIFSSLFLYGEESNISINTISLDSKMDGIPLSRNIQYLEDLNGTISIKNLLLDAKKTKKKYIWKQNTKKSLGFGYSSSTYWLKFKVQNKLNKKLDWFLEIDYPHLDLINIYSARNDNYVEKKSGDKYNFSKRDVKYRNFIFNNKSNPNSITDYYIKIKSTSSMSLPIYLWSKEEITNKITNEYLLLGIYFGIILIIAVYNFFIYFSTKDISYLFYVLWVAGYGLYQFAVNGLAYQYLWNESPVWANISLPFFISFGTTFGLLFGKFFLSTHKTAPKIDKLLIGLASITFLNTLLSFVLPYSIITRISVVSVIVMVVLLLVSGIVAFYNGYSSAKYYIIAWSTLLIGVAVFALKALGVLPSNVFTEWSQQIGSVIEVTLLSFALADKIKVTENEKKKAQRESFDILNRYKMVIEGASEIIFTLDDDWKILSVNKAVKKHFNMKPEMVVSKNLIDLIYEDRDGKGRAKEIVRNKLDEFLKDKKTISFKADFKSIINSEPKEMNIQLEYLNIDGKTEILGKAYSVGQDSLMKFFEFEKQRMSIGNHLTKVEDVSYRITRNLIKYIDHKEINLIKIALREIIINAIEHGNLNISYEDKTEAMMNDNYFAFISERQSDLEYSDRKVNIVFSIDEAEFVVKITDDGDGFDHEKMKREKNRANDEMLSHGRGIFMTQGIFDEMRYNKKGNQVLLRKRFK